MNGSQRQQLETIARNAMRAQGFEPDFPPAAEAQAALGAAPRGRRHAARPARSGVVVDRQRRLARSRSDRGLRPATAARTRVLVGIADVDVARRRRLAGRRARGSATPRRSTRRRSSSRCCRRSSRPIGRRSTRTGSPRDRRRHDGRAMPATVSSADVYRALVRNKAQLAYNAVAAWLDGQAPAPAALTRVAGLDAQLTLQDAIAQRLQAGARRGRRARLRSTRAARRSSTSDGVSELQTDAPNRAKQLIENFMVAANGVGREISQRARPAVDPPRRADTGALGPHRRSRVAARDDAAGASPMRRRCSSS